MNLLTGAKPSNRPVFILFLLGCWMMLFPSSCKPSGEGDSAENTRGLTPVTVTHPKLGTIVDAVTLNANSSFLVKTVVKADLNGYLARVDIQPGEKVIRGQTLFVIRSKEAERLGNTISKLDTSFRFTGMVPVSAPATGYVTDLSHTANDYVQEGDALVTISDLNSLVFLLNLPFELNPYVRLNHRIDVSLPDGEHLHGTLSQPMATLDPSSQTQPYIIRISGEHSLPENLIGNVRFIKKSKPGVIMLPRDAVLTNEVQSEYWIMKMTDSTTAVKVPVTCGIENADQVEIVSPVLKPGDRILLTGNYGLPDTAHVAIQKPE